MDDGRRTTGLGDASSIVRRPKKLKRGPTPQRTWTPLLIAVVRRERRIEFRSQSVANIRLHNSSKSLASFIPTLVPFLAGRQSAIGRGQLAHSAPAFGPLPPDFHYSVTAARLHNPF